MDTKQIEAQLVEWLNTNASELKFVCGLSVPGHVLPRRLPGLSYIFDTDEKYRTAMIKATGHEILVDIEQHFHNRPLEDMAYVHVVETIERPTGKCVAFTVHCQLADDDRACKRFKYLDQLLGKNRIVCPLPSPSNKDKAALKERERHIMELNTLERKRDSKERKRDSKDVTTSASPFDDPKKRKQIEGAKMATGLSLPLLPSVDDPVSWFSPEFLATSRRWANAVLAKDAESQEALVKAETLAKEAKPQAETETPSTTDSQ